ncbi:hypothetical protein PF008_g26479 [Phytophthora fragariae]|uniref:RxLR effector protein n=2 Tax=Phytophthora TaxID=4783 RepID=A0A6A3KWV6_9STRA|nr:hypothetical protein PR002_g15983 [Phytophthora rubi]KAE9287181.1 hypothetical protein PF008_g26479 [Phytophthora fragariae]
MLTRLICLASSIRTPVAAVFCTFSDPARSTINILPRTFVPLARCFFVKVRIKTE